MKNDAWGALQARGVEATDGAPAGTSIAYADVDDRGRQVVGFDSAMVLPRVCLKCGSTDAPSDVTVAFRATGHWTEKLVAAADGRPLAAQKVGPGKYTLGLPYCDPCAARRRLGRRLRIVTWLWPLAIVALGFVGDAISSSLAAPLVVVGLLAWAGVSMTGSSLRKKGDVLIERVDGDGFVRVAAVNAEAAEAVVAAAQGA